MLKISLSIISFTVVLVLANSCSDKTTQPTPLDTTWPEVDSTYPARGADSVDFDAVITIWFSEPIDIASFKPEYFWVNDGLPGTLTFPNSRTLRFEPLAHLEPLTTYSLGLDTAIADTAGNQLTLPLRWTFTTRDFVLDTAWTRPQGGAELFADHSDGYWIRSNKTLTHCTIAGDLADPITLAVPPTSDISSCIRSGAGFVVAGSQEQKVYVASLSIDGSLIVERSFTLGGYSSASQIVELHDGGYSLAVQSDRGYLLRLNSHLDSLWSRPGPTEGGCLDVMTDGSIVIAGHHNSYEVPWGVGYACSIEFFRYSSSGGELWNCKAEWQASDDYVFAATVDEASDGGVLLLFQSEIHYLPIGTRLLKIDNAGTRQIFDREILPDQDIYGANMVALSDRSIAVVGHDRAEPPSPVLLLKDENAETVIDARGARFFPGSTTCQDVVETPEGWLVLGNHSLTRLVLR